MAVYWSVLCLAFLAGSLPARGADVAPQTASPSNLLQSYPSVVQIDFYLFWSSAQWSNECAGSVLTTRLIVTAASCVFGWSYEPRFRRIRAGSATRNSGGLIFYVDGRINHPGRYEPEHHGGDVSVVRLLNPLVYSPVIRQAALASPGSIIPDFLPLEQLGFGRADQPTLTVLPIASLPRWRCAPADGVSTVLNNTEHILCAQPIDLNSTANDDVGSPWFFGNVTVGIAGGINTVSVYNGLLAAPVAAFTEWIIDIAARGF